jgi:multidrug efflux pump subunit AcrA (membrane-fusion protein)
MRSALLAVVVAAALAATGCSRQSDAESPAAPEKKETVVVTVAPVATRAVERTVSVVGTLSANMQADVASEVEGQVTEMVADLGDRVTKDQPLARVRSDVLEARLREAEASLEKATADETRAEPLVADKIISAQEYEQVRTALAAEQAVRVTVDPYPGETFNGTLSRVGTASNPTARSLAFEALVPNGDHRLRPGFFGRAEIVVRKDEHAVAVPRSAVTTFAGVTKLFVVEDGVAREREVSLGVDLGDGWVEIMTGVSKGMQVATSGLSKLANGTEVTVRADATPGA